MGGSAVSYSVCVRTMARLSPPRAPEGPHASHVLSCSRHTAPSGPILLARQGPAAAAWFVRQPLQAVLHKTLHPLVDKAPADPDHGGGLGDRDSIGNE